MRHVQLTFLTRLPGVNTTSALLMMASGTTSVRSKPAHIQRGENLVQTAKFLGKTNVEEKRRTACCMIHCTFSRDFKAAALNELHQKETDPKKQQHIIKVEGKKRMKMFSAWIDKQFNAIEAVCKSLGSKKDEENPQ